MNQLTMRVWIIQEIKNQLRVSRISKMSKLMIISQMKLTRKQIFKKRVLFKIIVINQKLIQMKRMDRFKINKN